MGTACIFIDGENLRHSIIDLFWDEFNPDDYLPRNADWTGFFDALTKRALAEARLRSYWYVVEDIDFRPWGLQKLLRDPDPLKLRSVLCRDKSCAEELDAITNEREKISWVRQRAEEFLEGTRIIKARFEGWKVFQDGIANWFDAVEFRRSGSIVYNLYIRRFGTEKAVDVKLATDLLELRDIYDIGIIVSGDQDYVPAVQAVKDSGKQIVNVSFLKRDGSVLPGGARRLNRATDRIIEMSYTEVKGFMRFSPSRPIS